MVDRTALVPLLYVLVPILTMVSGAVLIYWLATRHRDRPGVRWYVVFLVGCQLWAGLLLVNLLVTEPSLQRAVHVLWTAVAFVTFVLWVVFVSAYTDEGYHRSRVARVAMGAFVAGYVALAATNDAHGWIYNDLPIRTGPLSYVAPDVGVGFVALLVIGLGLVGYSMYVLLVHLVTTQRRSAPQIVLVLVGLLSVSIVEALGQLGVFPAAGLHHAAFGLLPFQLLVALTLFRLRPFDSQPVARNTLVESLDDPIVLVDEGRRIVDYNRSAADHWPTITEHVGEQFRTTVPEVAARIELPSGDAESDHQLTLESDGETRHYSVTVSPITRQDAETVSWHAILFRDVTEIERSRRRLRRRNERLDQVAAAISNELREPIRTAAEHATELDAELRELAQAAPGPDDEVAAALEEGKSSLETTEESLRRMDEIIEDVLTLARTGRAVDETEPVELAAIARAAWETVETGDATLELAADPGWTVAADRSKLRSILENLFRNAIEHAGSAPTVTVGTTDAGFAVADDGPGIPADSRDAVFEYGYTTESDGTGLGLAIVRTMADAHGWTVDVDDAHETGTRFVFDCGLGAAGSE